MALSMEEERILTEIAARLSEEDPALAARLVHFGRMRRRHRLQLLAAIVVVLLVLSSVAGAVLLVSA